MVVATVDQTTFPRTRVSKGYTHGDASIAVSYSNLHLNAEESFMAE